LLNALVTMVQIYYTMNKIHKLFLQYGMMCEEADRKWREFLDEIIPYLTPNNDWKSNTEYEWDIRTNSE